MISFMSISKFDFGIDKLGHSPAVVVDSGILLGRVNATGRDRAHLDTATVLCGRKFVGVEKVWAGRQLGPAKPSVKRAAALTVFRHCPERDGPATLR